MTHALVDPEVTAQLPMAPPGDDPLPPVEPEQAAPDRPADIQEVAELIAARLTGLQPTGGHIMQLVGTATGHDTVVVDLTMLTGEEVTARVVLTLSVPPRPAELAIEDGGPR